MFSHFASPQHKISPVVEMTYVNHMLPFLLVISTIGENFCVPHNYILIEIKLTTNKLSNINRFNLHLSTPCNVQQLLANHYKLFPELAHPWQIQTVDLPANS